MTIISEGRASDSSLVESVIQGYTPSSGVVMRPASCTWHIVISKKNGCTRVFFVGPWESSGYCTYPSEAEILWIQFKVGVYLPLLLPSQFVNEEKIILEDTGSTLSLNGVSYQLPDFDNTEMFVQRLVKENNLSLDPLVHAVMQGHTVDAAPRTIRHRFLAVSGQSQKHIQQFQRACQAANWLRAGRSILDVTYDLGYADQSHLTRSLRRFIGFTPAQISKSS